MKTINTLLLLLCMAVSSFAQDFKHETSEAINVSEGGWNKVILAKNGNTVFFHFEQNKDILVKIFDAQHKEISSNTLKCSILNIRDLSSATLAGIVPLGEEIAMFIRQDVDKLETIIRIRIDANTGKLLSEVKLFQPERGKELRAFLTYDAIDNGYCFSVRRNAQNSKDLTLSFHFFNSAHQLVKEIPVAIAKDEFDAINVQGISEDQHGNILVLLKLQKLIKAPDHWNTTNLVAYLPKDGTHFIYKAFDLHASWSDYSFYNSYNRFAHTLNLLFSSKKGGILLDPAIKKQSLTEIHSMMVVKDDFSESNFLYLHDEKANNVLKSQIDSTQAFNGFPIDIFTNKVGLTTIAYFGTRKSTDDYINKTYKNTSQCYAITQVDDDGKEVWGGILPASYIRNRVSEKDYPTVFSYQHKFSLDGNTIINTKNNFYLVANDTASILNRPLKEGNVICSAEHTNAVCFKINRKKEITTSLLLGPVAADEYKQVCRLSADFNEDTGEYAAVFLHRQGKNIKTKIAWVHFEP